MGLYKFNLLQGNLNAMKYLEKIVGVFQLQMVHQQAYKFFIPGEKQMVCIARELLKQSKVILIDEATSSIDMNNEETFLRTIKERFDGCTVLRSLTD